MWIHNRKRALTFFRCSLVVFSYLCYTIMKTVQKITSLLLAIVFLLSSLGLSANKMVCLKSGKVKMSLVAQKECCAIKTTTAAVIKLKCCNLSNTYFNLSDLQDASKLSFHESFSVYSTATLFFFNSTITTISKPLAISFADLPPPRYGRTLLSFISILNI
jgi:hypothetical protein